MVKLQVMIYKDNDEFKRYGQQSTRHKYNRYNSLVTYIYGYVQLESGRPVRPMRPMFELVLRFGRAARGEISRRYRKSLEISTQNTNGGEAFVQTSNTVFRCEQTKSNPFVLRGFRRVSIPRRIPSRNNSTGIGGQSARSRFRAVGYLP